MKKEERVLEQILVFMKNEVSEKGEQLNSIYFNFKPSEVVRYFSNAGDESEIIADGEDLISLKKIVKIKNYKLIIPALNLAISEGFIKGGTNHKYGRMFLSEKGFARAKSFEVNENHVWKRRCDYFLDKVFVPLIVVIITSLITSYINQKSIGAEIKILKKEIE